MQLDPQTGVSLNFYPRSPRGERRTVSMTRFSASNFYPRSPRGERLQLCAFGLAPNLFLPALPARGATPHDS